MSHSGDGDAGSAAAAGERGWPDRAIRIRRGGRQRARQVNLRSKAVLGGDRDRVGEVRGLAGGDGLRGRAGRGDSEIRRRRKGEIQDALAAQSDRVGIAWAERAKHNEVRGSARHAHILQLRYRDNTGIVNSVVASDGCETAGRAGPNREHGVEIAARGVEASRAVRGGLELIPNGVGTAIRSAALRAKWSGVRCFRSRRGTILGVREGVASDRDGVGEGVVGGRRRDNGERRQCHSSCSKSGAAAGRWRLNTDRVRAAKIGQEAARNGGREVLGV
jgi:hypothetical protein